MISCVAAEDLPAFRLSPGESSGALAWRSHTFKLDGDFLVPQNDFIVEDPKESAVSLCLEWKTSPASSDGEFLWAIGSWSVPITALKEKAYIVSVRRQPNDTVAFTLSTLQGAIVSTSEACPISKGWSGESKDLAKHINIIPASELRSLETPRS